MCDRSRARACAASREGLPHARTGCEVGGPRHGVRVECDRQGQRGACLRGGGHCAYEGETASEPERRHDAGPNGRRFPSHRRCSRSRAAASRASPCGMARVVARDVQRPSPRRLLHLQALARRSLGPAGEKLRHPSAKAACWRCCRRKVDARSLAWQGRVGVQASGRPSAFEPRWQLHGAHFFRLGEGGQRGQKIQLAAADGWL